MKWFSNQKPDLSRFCFCFCIEESTSLLLFILLGTPRQEPSLFWCNSGVAPRWPQLRYPNVERRFRDELQPASAVLDQSCPFRKGHRFPAVVHEAEVPQMRTRTRTNTSPNDTEACGQNFTRVRCAQVKIVNGKCVEARKFGPPPL